VPRGARRPGHSSPAISAAGSVVFLGGGRRGLGNLEPGPCFSGGGGGSGFPSAFPDWSSLVSVYSYSRDAVFPTSTVLLCEGLRSGTRRRRGASASAQAAGGTGPETRRTAPARAGTALCRRCVEMSGGCARSSGDVRGAVAGRCAAPTRRTGHLSGPLWLS